MIEYWIGSFVLFCGCVMLYFGVRKSIEQAEKEGEEIAKDPEKLRKYFEKEF